MVASAVIGSLCDGGERSNRIMMRSIVFRDCATKRARQEISGNVVGSRHYMNGFMTWTIIHPGDARYFQSACFRSFWSEVFGLPSGYLELQKSDVVMLASQGSANNNDQGWCLACSQTLQGLELC